MSLSQFESVNRYRQCFESFKHRYQPPDTRYAWVAESIQECIERLPRTALTERDELEELLAQVELFNHPRKLDGSTLHLQN
jgi:NTP pyrophosphatase (non-canonical NTP hydrolase)